MVQSFPLNITKMLSHKGKTATFAGFQSVLSQLLAPWHLLKHKTLKKQCQKQHHLSFVELNPGNKHSLLCLPKHIYITTFWSLFLNNKKYILTSIYSFLIYHASFCKAIQIIHFNFFPGYVCDSKIYIPELFVFRLYTFVQSPGNLLGMGRGKERRSQYILLFTMIKIKFKIIFKKIGIKLIFLEYLF